MDVLCLREAFARPSRGFAGKAPNLENTVTSHYQWNIRRPRPWPRQGRRLGPPQVWNFSFFAFHGQTYLAAKATHQWLLLGIQVCRLLAPSNVDLACFILQPTATLRHTSINNGFLRPLLQPKTLQTLKNRKTLKTLTWHASSCSQQPPRATHPWLLVGTPGPHINGFLWASKSAVCPP